MKRTAAYMRVSTEGQVDKYGLDAQKADILSYAQAKGLEIDLWFTDKGISGAIIDRPGLQDLMTAAREGEIDRVIIAKMDRLSRDLFSQLFIEKEMKLAGVEIISAGEPVNGNDPMNTAFRQMMGTFAELEKSLITVRLSGGRRQKAKTGGYSGGRAPIGYTAERGRKSLQIDKEKAETVKMAFALKTTCRTLQEIADTLNAAGHTTARGAQFRAETVKRILNRKIYAGTYEYSGIQAQGQHQAII